jgi:hypothetical protein
MDERRRTETALSLVCLAPRSHLLQVWCYHKQLFIYPPHVSAIAGGNRDRDKMANTKTKFIIQTQLIDAGGNRDSDKMAKNPIPYFSFLFLFSYFFRFLLIL